MSDEQRRLALPAPENRLALVIGVNQAPDAQTLSLRTPLKAHYDAEEIAHALHEYCGFELLLPPVVGQEATSEHVKSAILALSRQRTERDFLLLYFAGHGHPMPISGGLTDIFLVTHNFNEQEVEEDETMHVSMRWLRDKLYLHPGAGKVLLILDNCFSGNMGRTAADPYLEDLRTRIKTYFGPPGAESGSMPGGLRQALAATSHNQAAGEEGENGRLTGILLEALRGRIDETIDLANHGYITLYLLQNYFQRVMPESQRSSLSGDDAGKICILAQNEKRAEELRLRKRVTFHERPQTYIPLHRSASFQPRPDEFRRVTELLTTSSTQRVAHYSSVVGLTGMGGVGKTQLAVELACMYRDEQRFPSGIFWLSLMGVGRDDLCRQLAALSAHTEYLPPGDDVAHPENEEKRARHFCRYLAGHPDALLILDNVEKISSLLDLLPTFSGEEIRCAILYTSRNFESPPHVRLHTVGTLTDEGAMRLLLERRPDLLRCVEAGGQEVECQAARRICQYVERLPLALVLLRDLLQDENLSLSYLLEEQRRRGLLAITKEQDGLEVRLFQTFHMSWHKIQNPAAQRLFKLAACFPEIVHIPLWLLGLAADLPGENTSLDPLGQARLELQRWSLIEVLSSDTIRLHPLVREFGQYLLQQDAVAGQRLQAEAGIRLVAEFTDINKLERRARAKGYWGCLDDVEIVLNYARLLQSESIDVLEHIEYWLARDSSLLGTGGLWLDQLPGLFYQQLYNRAIEEGFSLLGTAEPVRWIRQVEQVRAEERALLRELKHPHIVTSIDFSPDDRTVVTGCEDGIARIWDVAHGRLLQQLAGHTAAIMGVEYSRDGRMVVTGSEDGTARVWNTVNGREMHVLGEKVLSVRGVTFSPNNERVLAICDGRIACVWDVKSEQLIANIGVDAGLLIGTSFFLNETNVLIISTNGEVTLWDVSRKQVVKTLRGRDSSRGVLDAAVSRDGKIVMIALYEHVVIWDVERQTPLAEFPYQVQASLHIPGVPGMALSAHTQLAVMSFEERSMQIWHIPDKKLVTKLSGHRDTITSMRFSHDGMHVATGSADTTARVWRVANAVTTNMLMRTQADEIKHVRFSAQGTQVVTGHSDGSVHIWDSATRMPVETLTQRFSWIASVAFSADGRKIAVGSHDAFYLTDLEQQQTVTALQDIGPMGEVGSLCFLPDGKTVATGSSDEVVRLWSHMQNASEQRNSPLPLCRREGEVRAIMCLPDGKRLLAGSSDGKMCIINLENYAIQAEMSGEYGATCLDVSPDEGRIVVGTSVGVVQTWWIGKQSIQATLHGHTGSITCVRFSPNGRLLITADRYGKILLWKMGKGVHSQLLGMYNTVHEIGDIFWQDKKHIIVVDKGGTRNRPSFYRLSLEGKW